MVKGAWIKESAIVIDIGINRLEDGWHINRVGGLARVKVNGVVVRTTTKLNRLDIVSIGRTKLQFRVRP